MQPMNSTTIMLSLATLAFLTTGCIEGPMGPQGDRGEQGIQGPRGLPGEDGRDGINGATVSVTEGTIYNQNYSDNAFVGIYLPGATSNVAVLNIAIASDNAFMVNVQWDFAPTYSTQNGTTGYRVWIIDIDKLYLNRRYRVLYIK